MSNVYEESVKRIETLESIDFSSATSHIIGFLTYLESISDVKPMLESLGANASIEEAIKASSYHVPPKLRTLEDIASASVILLNLVKDKQNATVLCNLGIRSTNGTSFGGISYEFTHRYIRPLFAHLVLSLNKLELLAELRYRQWAFISPQFQESTLRIAGFWDWLIATPPISQIISQVLDRSQAQEKLKLSNYACPLQTESPDEIIAIGLLLMKECAEGEELFQAQFKYGIHPEYGGTKPQDACDTIMQRYIQPAINHIEEQLTLISDSSPQESIPSDDIRQPRIPADIRGSLAAFNADHSGQTAFIMMKFIESPTHDQILLTIKRVLSSQGITALRADDRVYHPDLFTNVRTYMHGCTFGVAIFEAITGNDFNPNVSLEVGYMLALEKPICFLKDKKLPELHSDLTPKLYKAFDTYAVEPSLSQALLKWLEERKPLSPAPDTV
jgi:hypothetical protein